MYHSLIALRTRFESSSEPPSLLLSDYHIGPTSKSNSLTTERWYLAVLYFLWHLNLRQKWTRSIFQTFENRFSNIPNIPIPFWMIPEHSKQLCQNWKVLQKDLCSLCRDLKTLKLCFTFMLSCIQAITRFSLIYKSLKVHF